MIIRTWNQRIDRCLPILRQGKFFQIAGFLRMCRTCHGQEHGRYGHHGYEGDHGVKSSGCAYSAETRAFHSRFLEWSH